MSASVIPSWYSTTVRDLVATTQQDPSLLPILADALLDAGCPYSDLDANLRQSAHWSDWARTGYLSRLADPERLASYCEQRASALAAQAKQTKKEADTKRAVDLHRGKALAIAKSFHKRIEDLYTSKRAEVVYGSGGQEGLDWDAYGRKYRPNGRSIPAKWKNAGVRIEGVRRWVRIVIENSRGKLVARLPLPPADCKTGDSCLHGDLFSVIRRVGQARVATRYTVTRSQRRGVYDGYAISGYAVRYRIAAAEVAMWARVTSTTQFTGEADHYYWEHGSTVAACRAEHTRKLALAQQRQAESEQRHLADEAARKRQARIDRKARLIVRLCGNLVITRDDSYAAGNCAAGTAGFVERFGMASQDYTTVSALRALAEQEPRALRVIEHVARRLATAKRIHLPVIA